eukprot:gene42721-56787_t
MAISSNGLVIARLVGGLGNTTLSNATYTETIANIKSAADINTYANDLVARDFAGKTDLQIATVLLSNLGLSSVAGLNNWVAAQITAAGAAGKGAKIASLLNDFANLTDASDKAAADASKAIDDATVADAAVTAAQTALAAATTKAALTDATALTTATTAATTASTTAATAKTAADTGLVAANTALSTLLASANPVAAD